MVLYQNSFFLSHLSMLHLLARSVFLELHDVPRRAHTPAQQQGGLESIPTLSHALQEETSSPFIFSS